MKLFDSHCHVHDERMPGGTGAAVEIARAAGVAAMVTVGCDRATSLAAIEAAGAYDDVWATVGLHPHEAVHGVDTIVDLFDRPRVVAVGEAGLDYFYEHSPRPAQAKAFASQIQLAQEHDLPLIIHTRDAWADTFAILDAEGVPDRTILHCFTGGPDEARKGLDRNMFVSFSGIVTFKSAADVQAAARLVPDANLLIETDAPYLAPVPHRGKPNQPAWVADTARFVADLRDVAVDELAALTYANGLAAFPAIAH
ncbi:MAG: TatD family hydrolase [Ilumatobacteraceae bacterium]